MAQYRCKHFKIKELVHPDMLNISDNILWMIFDDRLLRCIDMIRDKYGACTVNTSALKDCGLRKLDSTTGATFSSHKYGRACDLHICDIEHKAGEIKDVVARKKWKIEAYEKVRKEILSDSRFDVLNMETGIGWLHVDTFGRDVRLFNP